MKYLLAVSGGPDSMAMLDMYRKKAQAVCVVNYNKRHDCHQDVKIVQDYCRLHNIKCYVHIVDKKTYENHKKDNFQALARKIRYDFFKQVALTEQNNHLMIAHNLNDHFETAYMQFARSSKALFYGIKRKSNYEGLQIYRPVLEYKKSTLQRYCDNKHINYAIDYTNNMDIYERNRVRKIINSWDSQKQLEFNKKIKQYNKQNKRMDKKVQSTWKKWQTTDYKISFFNLLDGEFKYYLIYEYLKYFGEKNNSKNKVDSIINFILKSSKNSKFRLENTRFLVKKGDFLKII